MGQTYDYRPNISERPYLTSDGHTHKSNVIHYLEQAIEDMEDAAEALKAVKGLGAELYLARLDEVIPKLKNLKIGVDKLG